MAIKYNQGHFFPRNPQKYVGNITKITYRSEWEKKFMLFLDKNSDVLKWNSEEIVVPYLCETDDKIHRYFMDFYVEFKNGKKFLIEIKPYCQTQKPIKKNQHMKTFLNEIYTYTKNQSKWRQAKIYAEKRGYVFQVWTENELQRLGINV